MNLRIGDNAPDFSAVTTHGRIDFHRWIGDSWCILFSHPGDYTPVCTTEFGAMARLHREFEKRNCKVIGLSVDSVNDHLKWVADVEDLFGAKVEFPIIADTDLTIAMFYGMLQKETSYSAERRSALSNATVRTVFVIKPDKTIALTLSYPMNTGRNFDEILRVVDSLQLTWNNPVATPADWKNGDDVIIQPAMSDRDAAEEFPDGWETLRSYYRTTEMPGMAADRTPAIPQVRASRTA